MRGAISPAPVLPMGAVQAPTPTRSGRRRRETGASHARPESARGQREAPAASCRGPGPRARTHAGTHTRTHARTRAHTHPRTPTRASTGTHARPRAHAERPERAEGATRAGAGAGADACTTRRSHVFAACPALAPALPDTTRTGRRAPSDARAPPPGRALPEAAARAVRAVRAAEVASDVAAPEARPRSRPPRWGRGRRAPTWGGSPGHPASQRTGEAPRRVSAARRHLSRDPAARQASGPACEVRAATPPAEARFRRRAPEAEARPRPVTAPCARGSRRVRSSSSRRLPGLPPSGWERRDGRAR